jgi:hypothetical protein
MKSIYAKILCFVVATLLLLPAFGFVVDAAKKGHKISEIGMGKEKHENKAPTVIIETPIGTYVQGNELTIVVKVKDENEGALAVILVDQVPTWNTENKVTIDIRFWPSWSEHFITAAYTDPYGETGGDIQYLVKI